MPDAVHQLTAALAAGEAAAVETFYRRYFDFLYRQVRRATGRDEAFCLDVVQDAVLRILRSVRPARTEAQFRAWLKLVVQTTAYDLLRSESRRKSRELAMAATAEATHGEREENDQERMQWLAGEIAKMDVEILRMINMRYQRRWTLARVAEALGLTIGTIDGRLRRALAELRQRATEVFDE